MTMISPSETSVSAADLRQVMSHYLTGVTIVTVMKPDGTPYGLTVNSFNSVSLDPPLILWSLDNKSSQLSLFSNATGFATVYHVGNILFSTCTHMLYLADTTTSCLTRSFRSALTWVRILVQFVVRGMKCSKMFEKRFFTIHILKGLYER